MPVIIDAKRFWSSLIFLVLGIGIGLQEQTYVLGTVTDMGPGYFLTLLGAVLVVLGTTDLVIACHGSDVVPVGR